MKMRILVCVTEHEDSLTRISAVSPLTGEATDRKRCILYIALLSIGTAESLVLLKLRFNRLEGVLRLFKDVDVHNR